MENECAYLAKVPDKKGAGVFLVCLKDYKETDTGEKCKVTWCDNDIYNFSQCKDRLLIPQNPSVITPKLMVTTSSWR